MTPTRLTASSAQRRLESPEIGRAVSCIILRDRRLLCTAHSWRCTREKHINGAWYGRYCARVFRTQSTRRTVGQQSALEMLIVGPPNLVLLAGEQALFLDVGKHHKEVRIALLA